MIIGGIDEAGRGPVLGPMVITLAIANKEAEVELKKMGVKDSKELLPNKRKALIEGIKNNILEEKTQIITPLEINDMMAQYSLNEIEAIRIGQLINEAKILPDIIYVDSPDAKAGSFEKRIRKYLTKEKQKIKIIAENKADSNYVIVGAASIIAKVTRDEEIIQLANKYGEFGSLPFDEEVLTENNGIISLVKIGDLVKTKPNNTCVFSLNKKTLKIELAKISAFIEHPTTKVYKITLERGKIVRLTLNHPIFVLNKEGQVIYKKVQDLKNGEHVAVAGNIPKNKHIKRINLIDYLASYSTKANPIYLKGPQVSKLFIKNKNEFLKSFNITTYTRSAFYNWKKKSAIPLHIFIKGNSKINLKHCYLCSREEMVKIPVLFNITKEFMWFLGIYVAEGWASKYQVCVSSFDKTVFSRIKKFCKPYGLHTHISKDWIAFSSIVFTKLLESWVVGKKAHTKKLPEFVFSCSKMHIKSALDGLYEGDGWIKNKNWEIELKSKELIKQTQWLNLMLNKFSSNKIRQNRKSYITRILSKSSNSLSPDNIPSIIGLQLKQTRISKRLSQQQFAQKLKIAKKVLQNIEQQKVNSIQKKTLKKFYKTTRNKQLKLLINSDLCWLKIKRIKYLSKEKVYDIGVNRNENFLGGNNGIILHNSGYPSDPKTKKYLADYVEQNKKLPPFARIFWSTSTNALNKIGQ